MEYLYTAIKACMQKSGPSLAGVAQLVMFALPDDALLAAGQLSCYVCYSVITGKHLSEHFAMHCSV